MKEQFENAIVLIKEQKNINGCVAGSAMLGFNEKWDQDIDIFCYDEQSFVALLYFMHYNPIFSILDKLELHKFEDYTRNGKSSLDSIGLITIKFTYNVCIPINIIYKKSQKNIFDVISAFDIDLIAQGYCLKTGKTLSLRETSGNEGTWNKWNSYFYKTDFWNIKKLLRQFERVVKYTHRGYNLSSVTDKYIEILEEIIKTENFYKTEKGSKYFNDTIEQFEVVLKILQAWKKDQSITPEEILTLKTLI